MTVIEAEAIPAIKPSRSGYLPYLDGLRGIAILMVLVYHAHGPLFKGGYIGVDIFFVLSGFLITSLLIKEWDRTGRIGLGHFYMRRALRLIPAVVALLVVFLAVSWFVSDDFRRCVRDALIVLFYAANWVRATGENLYALGHTWSLSIEEQFYLLWPLMFVGLRKAKLSRPSLAWLLLAAAVASAIARIVLHFNGASDERLYNGLDTHADGLLLGCSLAFFLTESRLESLATRAWVKPAGFAAMATLLAISLVVKDDAAVMFLGGFFVVVVAAAVVIIDLQSRANTVARKVTEWPALVKLGRISYGVYLWHFPIYKVLFDLRKQYGWSARWPLYLFVGGPIAIGVAVVSYRFLEIPFLRLKKKFQ